MVKYQNESFCFMMLYPCSILECRIFIYMTCVTVSQRLDQGHSTGDDIHPSLCQLPGFCLDVSSSETSSFFKISFVVSYFLRSDRSLQLSALCTNLLSSIRYFFPRQILIPHFWTPSQQVEFRGVYHSLRAQHHRLVLKGLEHASQKVTTGHLQSRLKDLCAKVCQ